MTELMTGLPHSDYGEDLIRFGQKARELAEKYAKERIAYARTKTDIDLIYAANMKKVTEWSKTASYEKGLLYLVSEEGSYMAKMYREMNEHYHKYKAIERLLNATEASAQYLQSTMKYNKQMDSFGKVN